MIIDGIRLSLTVDTYLGGGLYYNPRQMRFEVRHLTRGVVAWLAGEVVYRAGPRALYEWWERLWQTWARLEPKRMKQLLQHTDPHVGQFMNYLADGGLHD